MARMAPRKLPEALIQKPSSPIQASSAPSSPLSTDTNKLLQPIPNSHSAPTSATHSSTSSENDLASGISSMKIPSSPTKTAGRAGMVRTTWSASVIQAGATSHSAVMGRGYNKFTSIQQNDKPFLPSSVFTLNPVSMCVTHKELKLVVVRGVCFRSIHSDHGKFLVVWFNRLHAIYHNVTIHVHEGELVTVLPERVLPVDVKSLCRAVLVELCFFSEIDAVKPLYLYSRDLQRKLDDDQPFSVYRIRPESILEVHVGKIVDASSETTSPVDQAFLAGLRPNGIYLTLLTFNLSRSLMALPNGVLPTLEICSADSDYMASAFIRDFQWAKSKSLDWEVPSNDLVNVGVPESMTFTKEALEIQLNSLEAQAKGNGATQSSEFRVGFMRAVLGLMNHLSLKKLGHLYPYPVRVSGVQNCIMIPVVQFSSHISDDVMKRNDLKWKTIRNLNQKYYNPEDDVIWAIYLDYFSRCRQILRPGVYMGLVSVYNSLDSIEIVVPRHNPELVPLVPLRTMARSSFSSPSTPTASGVPAVGSHVSIERAAQYEPITSDEWTYIKYLAERSVNPSLPPPENLNVNRDKIEREISMALINLKQKTCNEAIELKHLYPELITLAEDVSLIVISPADTLHIQQKEVPSNSAMNFLKRLPKLSIRKSKTDVSSGQNSEMAELGLAQITLGMFELLHHHAYNPLKFLTHRHELDRLQMEIWRAELAEQALKQNNKFLNPLSSLRGTSAPGSTNTSASDLSSRTGQQILDSLNAKKKEWNQERSWVLKVIQYNREKLLQQKLADPSLKSPTI